MKVKGHNVVLVGRSRVKTETLARELNAPFHFVDYTRLADVKRLATELSRYDRIDVLANNAGGMMGERQVTEDGFEKTFQVNHLAPFFNVTDLNNERGYAPHTAYGYGKLENILFTRELDRRYRAHGISAVAFHPGVVRSNFASDSTHFIRFVYQSPLKYLMTISPERSGRKLTALAEGRPRVDWQPGEVYANGKPMAVAFKDDGTVARELWERSEAFLKDFL